MDSMAIRFYSTLVGSGIKYRENIEQRIASMENYAGIASLNPVNHRTIKSELRKERILNKGLGVMRITRVLLRLNPVNHRTIKSELSKREY